MGLQIEDVVSACATSSWEKYKSNWRIFIPFAAYGIAFGLLGNLIMPIFHTLSPAIGSDPSLLVLGIAIALICLIAIFSTYLSNLLQFALIENANDLHSGRLKGFTDYLHSNIWPAAAISLFYIALGVLVLLAFLAVLVLGGAAGSVLSPDALSKSAGAATQPGDVAFSMLFGAMMAIMIFLIPFLILAFLFNFFFQFHTYEMAAGKAGLLLALKNSLELVRSNLVLVFVCGLIFYVLFIIISIPVVFFQMPYQLITDENVVEFLSKYTSILVLDILALFAFVPAAFASWIFLQPLTTLILVKYWRLLKGKDTIQKNVQSEPVSQQS